jgi:Cytochrome P460
MTKAALMALALAAVAAAQQYTKDGDLIFPKDYRSWVFLSSGIGMSYSNEANPSPAFDNVFVNPSALKEFLMTGAWPDKTILILENRASASHSSNKEGKFQTEVLAVEAHVKDSSRGGWNFYGFAKDSGTGRPFPKTARCFSCHEKNGASDTTFVQFYPTLIEAAKKFGKYNDSGDVR